MAKEYTEHPVYGYLTADEYEVAKRAPYGDAKYWKKLSDDRRKQSKKKKAR